MDRHELINEMREDCACERNEYCPLEAILRVNINPRFCLQNKLVEKFKYDLGNRLKRDVDWNEAYIVWREEGYAEKFAKEYQEGITYKQLKKTVYDSIKPKK